MKITRDFGMLNHNWDIYITTLFQGSGVYVKEEVGEFQGCELMDDTKKILVSRHHTQTPCIRAAQAQARQNPSMEEAKYQEVPTAVKNYSQLTALGRRKISFLLGSGSEYLNHA